MEVKFERISADQRVGITEGLRIRGHRGRILDRER